MSELVGECETLPVALRIRILCDSHSPKTAVLCPGDTSQTVKIYFAVEFEHMYRIALENLAEAGDWLRSESPSLPEIRRNNLYLVLGRHLSTHIPNTRLPFGEQPVLESKPSLEIHPERCLYPFLCANG